MSKTEDGGPAFPVHGGHSDDDPRNRVLGGGMTLRDWFAGMAPINEIEAGTARAILGEDQPEDPLEAAMWVSRALARLRYVFADALLAERQRRGE